jgi:4-amino-4-deoxy-L-arabinose transferase-like glycosyltransferase
MFGFISGSVNNDVGVDAVAALVIYLIIRALRRGLPRWLWVGLGVAVAVLPLMKGTGYELFPAIAFALVALIAARRSRPALIGLGLAVAAFAVATLGWGTIAADFHRATVTTGGANSGAGGVTSLDQLGGHLTYLWETFLPRLPFMSRHFATGLWPFYFIYIQRGFGAFGWYAIFFPGWVYVLIVTVTGLAGAAAVAAIVRRWDAARAHWREAVFLLLIILAAVAGVAFYYYSPTPRPKPLTPEQGRYAFTAMVPLVALALCGLYALSRRTALAVATVLVSAMIVLSIGARLLYLTSTFT